MPIKSEELLCRGQPEVHILVIDGAWNVPKRIFRPKRRDGGTNEDSCDQIARSARADTSQIFRHPQPQTACKVEKAIDFI